MHFTDILRFCEDNYNRITWCGIDENVLRWLKPGFMQLFFSLWNIGFGYYFEDVETCSIDDISEVLKVLGFVMATFALIHIILGLLTHCSNENDEKGYLKFTTCAWTTVPIFSTYWVIVIGTCITQIVLQTYWAWPVFLGKWPSEAVPSVDYNDKTAENFCEKTPFMTAFVFLVFDMIIGCIVIFSWFWKLFKWCGLCCCCCCCDYCGNPNADRLFRFIQRITCREQPYVPIIE